MLLVLEGESSPKSCSLWQIIQLPEYTILPRSFNALNVLTKMHILYHKYDYLLDFEKMNGSLLVIRG